MEAGMELMQDLRFVIRRLRKSLLFTLAAIGTLSLAIAANVAVFSAVSAVLLRPLPIRQPDRVMVMSEAASGQGQNIKEVSYRNFLDWRAQSRTFTAIAAMGSGNRNFVIERAGELLRIRTAMVSGSFFELLGVNAQRGRAIVPSDDVRGAERVLVLSDRLWRQRFNTDPAVVGTPVSIRNQSYTIVGVMAPELSYPGGAEAWVAVVPALEAPDGKTAPLEARYYGLLRVLGRLAPGASAEQARAELDVIARRLPESTLASVSGSAVTVTPLLDDIFGPTRRGLFLLFAMVCFVLLIACANISSLVLARATGLGRTFAIKSALGASRPRLMREWFLEMAVVAAVAAGLGLGLAWVGLRPLLAMAPSSLPRLDHARIDLPVLVFTLGISVVTTMLCAAVPALYTSARTAKEALVRVRAGYRRDSLFGRGLLTALQVAFATVLLIGALLLVRSFDQLRQIDLGFEAEHVMTLDVEPQTTSTTSYHAAYDTILERVKALPMVDAVGAVTQRPLAGRFGYDTGYLLEGQSIDRPETFKDNVVLNFQAVTPGYFEAMRIALRGGRFFSSRDTAEAPGVAIVSESTARRLWPDSDAIGKRLSIAAGATVDNQYPTQTVVGIVKDVRYRGIDDRRFDIYMPATQTQHRVKQLMVRTVGDPAAVARSVQAALRDGTTPTLVTGVTTMEQVLTDVVAPWRFSMTLLVSLATLGVFLAVAGLFALVAYSVEQRAPELALRLAIGASPGAILRSVMWDGARFALAGLAVGVVFSLAVSHRISALLFQVPPRDVATFVTAAGLLATTALLAGYLAARRVTRIDPLLAMREE
jgi:putative ABC transport system permease protein